MWNLNNTYLCAVLVLIIFTISLSLATFLLTVFISAILGILIFLELKLPHVQKDYELFKQNHSINFIEQEPYGRHYCSKRSEQPIVTSNIEFNQSFTENSEIDNHLNEVLELTFKHHIYPWYNLITTNRDFPTKLYSFIRYTITSFVKRTKNVNVANFVTTKLVDELIKHKKLYRLTKNKLYAKDEFSAKFFINERLLEKNFSRENICLNHDSLIQFLSQICDLLQYILTPYNSFNADIFKDFTQQFFIKSILFPLFDTLSEPDFLNGIVVSLLKTNIPSTETFITVLQSTDDVNELNAVLESVEEDILFARSKDDDDEMKMKQQLNSLLYLKRFIMAHLKKFVPTENLANLTDEDPTSPSEQPNNQILFDTILKHNNALEYFIDYMTSVNAVHYINFYINVESFKISVEQGLFEIYLTTMNENDRSEQNLQLQEMIKEAANNIYETYLEANGPNRLTLLDDSYKVKLKEMLDSEDTLLKDTLFDEIFYRVRHIIINHEPFFPSFKQSRQYRKLFDELDSTGLDDYSLKSFDDLTDSDSCQLNSLLTKQPLNVQFCEDAFTEHKASNESEEKRLNCFNIDIVETGLLNEYGKSFVAYLINIRKNTGEQWVILRRYSEFYSFHQSMLGKCEKFRFNLKSILVLPPKSVLSNHTSEKFVRYRKYMLNIYLKKLNYLYEKFSFLRDDVDKFLQPGNYLNKSNSLPNRVDNPQSTKPTSVISNPIKSLGEAMKNGSENILDSFQKLGRTLSLQPAKVAQNSLKSPLMAGGDSQADPLTYPYLDDCDLYENNVLHGSSGNSECEDNIPLLCLLEEIFDLESSNFWLRRRIIDLFKQIVEATYSETINKKIADYINDWTSPESISEFIKLLKNSFWPNGNLAEPVPRKLEDMLRCKVAAKALILTYLQDWRRVIGPDTLQNGVIEFFDLFQHKTLNLRLVIVLFELIIKEIFPNNYFDEVFARLYLSFDSKNPPNLDGTDWPPYLSQFVSRS